MYLKRLDIQGFKSFANKTTLEFGSGVTCVIGPNGTGKTNVADSLRWVLGEHASRNLRARKTEDVIFAGSDKRAPLGAAEVSITLDNEQKWLPIDFDEVVVTRRAYRNGENEYLINHAKVRLRDVVELFMRAQVGQNSYAFMGQGMVEQALSLRPEDRRALIEEAADVRLYRTKLEDARHKLKATRENMERVYLLVREIEPRITQLERQAGRAVKYQEYTRELAATLHVWFAHQWREVNDLLLASYTTRDQLTSAAEQARQASRACEDGLAQLRAAIDERRHDLSARESRRRVMLDYLADLQRRAALDAERRNMLAERIEELAAEIAALQADLAAQDDVAPPPDLSEQESRLAALRETLGEQRQRLSTVETELHAAQRDALSSEQAAARARNAAQDLGRRITEAADTVARLRREADAAAEARRKDIVDLAAWAKHYLALHHEQRDAARDARDASAERARTVDILAAARRTHTALDDEVRGLRAELDAANVRLELLSQIDVQPPAPDAGVRAVLQAGGILKREPDAEGPELSGVLGVVGQIVRVPAGFDRAIEAALADNLYAIVVEREIDMRAAVDMLLGGDAGRATIYALDSVQEQRPLHLIKERGIIGVASGLVKCDGRYRRLVDTLLGRTVIVEDRAVAHRVIRRGLAQAVATLDGVLLRPVGSVSAGVATQIEATFTYGREVGDLPAQVERLTPLVAERGVALADAAAAAEAAQRRMDQLDAEADAVRERRARADSAIAAARVKLASFRTRMHGYGRARAARSEQEQRIAASRGKMEAERDDATRQALAADEQEQAARRAIAELETARTQVNDALAETAAAVAHADGELRGERDAYAGDRAARDRLARQIASKREQLARFEDEGRTIGSRLGSLEQEIAGKSAEAETLTADIEPAKQELAQFESRERTLSAELVEANGRMRDAERALLDADNDVNVRQEELDNLRMSLEAEGFVATDDGEVERAPQPDPAPQDEEPAAVGEGDRPGELPRWMRTPGDPDLPPIRGGSTINPIEVRDRIAELRAQIRGLGPVNEQAASDYADSRERYEFLTTQLNDLNEAESQLNDAIDELEKVIRERFRETFKVVNAEFERYFSAFFRGGTARLELGETDDDGLPGVDIYAQPPGKKLGSLALLSGGERSLTAVALLFALLQANPSPICVLDEVDAALDEANVGRFADELRQLAQKTQFVIITHNRRTIETADAIYGVSMGADNVSRVLSLKLADVPRGAE